MQSLYRTLANLKYKFYLTLNCNTIYRRTINVFYTIFQKNDVEIDSSNKKDIQSDESTTKVYKSIFNTCEDAKNRKTGNWVTFNPQYFWLNIISPFPSSSTYLQFNLFLKVIHFSWLDLYSGITNTIVFNFTTLSIYLLFKTFKIIVLYINSEIQFYWIHIYKVQVQVLLLLIVYLLIINKILNY